MTPTEKAMEIAKNNCSHVGCTHGEHFFDSTGDCYKSAIQMYQWAQTAIDELELENRRLNARIIEMSNEFIQNNNMQSLKTKSKKSMSERILDATEKLCVIFLVIFIWSSAFFLVAVGIYALFNLL